MTTLTIEIPKTLDDQLSRTARRTRQSKAVLAKRALQEFLQRQAKTVNTELSVADVAGHLFGSVNNDGPADLSINKNHFEDYGK